MRFKTHRYTLPIWSTCHLSCCHPQDPKAKEQINDFSNAIREGMKDPVLKPKEYETINAALPSSGMIQAAADAAEQLRALFQ